MKTMMNPFKAFSCWPLAISPLISALFLLPFALFASGGDDHSHGEEKPTVAAEAPAHRTVEALSDKYELLLRFGEIAVGEESHLTLFISDFATNRPVDDAELKITAQEDASIVFTVTKTGEGTYSISATFPEAKSYSLAVSIASKAGADLILLAGVEAGGHADHDAHGEEGSFWATYQSWLLAALALIVGLGLGILLGKRNTKAGRSAISVLLLLLTTTFPQSTVEAQHNHAHGPNGEHLDTKPQTVNFSNTFQVPKETQFLFNVFTEKVASGSFVESTKLFGTIVPSSSGQAMVSTPQNGRIVSLSVRVGQQVKAGQQLAVVEQNMDASAQVGMMSEKNSLTAEYDAAKKAFERLSSIEDIAAKKDVDEAKARLQKAEANLNLFSGTSGRTIVLNAPISGVVANFNLSKGATVNAGQTLFTITDLSTIYAEAQVFDKDASKVKQGAKFTIECANDNHTCSEVKLISLAQEINASNQSQRVLFELGNPDSDFKIGEFVNIRVFASEASQQIALPNSAITEMNGKPVVFIKDAAEKFTVSYVQLGDNNGTHTSILKGVEEGQRVVVNASYQLKMIFLNQ
jgi:cobalt-zinc-cadmium efflux system membrane fusion protein